jgi:hypothetical protein
MGASRVPPPSLLVVAAFSRHGAALDEARAALAERYGPVALVSEDYDFHHTAYYAATMGAGLRKRLLAFEPLVSADCLADVKRHTIGLEQQIADSGRFPEARPINLDPGLVQLGKFLLATTKDQAHRIYLRDGIFAEVTLRFQAGAFEPWPWTYADYREPAVCTFLNTVRAYLHERTRAGRHGTCD